MSPKDFPRPEIGKLACLLESPGEEVKLSMSRPFKLESQEVDCCFPISPGEFSVSYSLTTGLERVGMEDDSMVSCSLCQML